MFSMLLLLSACGTAQNSSGAETNSDSQDAAAEETVTKEGTFAGLADSHTIAVTIDDKRDVDSGWFRPSGQNEQHFRRAKKLLSNIQKIQNGALNA